MLRVAASITIVGLVSFASMPTVGADAAASWGGRVFNGDRSTPRGGVVVSLRGDASQANVRSEPTRADGGFLIQSMPAGTYTVAWRGIGADGHTASLFPGTSALNARDVGYVDNYVPQLGVPRLTATFGLLAETDEVIFLVAGEAKASMIASISAGASVPAARVTAQKQVLWLLDEAAASEL